jgi:DNA-binding NarL/FixJ family response regulator
LSAAKAGPSPGSAAPARSWSIVVVDDEGRRDAVELVRLVKARNRNASVVYLAAEHSTALEEAVRRAGVSFYAVKQSRDGDLARVIEVLLSRPHG